MAKRNLCTATAVLASVAGLVLALPALAQQKLPAGQEVSWVGVSGLDRITLERMGPGGDLAGALQASALGNRGGNGSCPEETCFECLMLDTYNPNDTFNPSVPGSEVINTVQTANSLTKGQPYLITIQCDVSYWSNAFYTAPTGSPGAHPTFLSPAVSVGLQGLVGSDWEYLFAYPNMDHGDFLASTQLHIVFDGISLDNGATFVDLTPLGGQVYSTTHSYGYLVEGQGMQAKFQVADSGPHSDNYGRFKICIFKLKPVTKCGSNGGGDD